MRAFVFGLALMSQVAHANTKIEVTPSGAHISASMSLPKGHGLRGVLKDVLLSSDKMKDLQVYTEPGEVFHSEGAMNGAGVTLGMVGGAFSLNITEGKSTVSRFSNDGQTLEIAGEYGPMRLFEALNASTSDKVERSTQQSLYGLQKIVSVKKGRSSVSCSHIVVFDVVSCVLKM